MEAEVYRERIGALRRNGGSLLRYEAATYLGTVPAFGSEITGILEFRSRGIIFYSAEKGHLAYIAAEEISDATTLTIAEAGLPQPPERDVGVLVIVRAARDGEEKLAFRVEYPDILAAGVKKLRDDSRKPAPAGDDVFVRIKKLAELREAGILTEEEFTAKKRELLKEI